MKNKKHITIISLLVILIATLSATYLSYQRHQTSSPIDYQEIREKGRIRVATIRSHIGYLSSESGAEGYSYEIVKKMADTDSLELEIILINDIKDATEGLNQGRYDIIAYPIPKTVETVQKASLTLPLFGTRQVLVQRVDSITRQPSITTYKQLDSAEIYIPAHSPHILRLKNMEKEIAVSIKLIDVPESTTEKLVGKVANGTIPMTVCDYLQAKKLQQKYSNIDLSLPIGFEQKYCWAVHKQATQLLDRINIFLSEFLISTDYMLLYSNYY